jgi:hypothetical protein
MNNKMRKQTKIFPGKFTGNQKGQALLLVIIFMLLGALILTPLLNYMGTGIYTGKLFQNKTDTLYAADAGIEDGTWQIKYDYINDFTSPTTYSSYDYATSWDYSLPEQVNNIDVDVTIKNEWIPVTSSLAAPTNVAQANNVISQGKLIVSDSNVDTSSSKISITVPELSSGSLGSTTKVLSLGVWLPPGFSYVAGSSNLWNSAHTQRLYSSENVTTYKSGQAVVWTFTNYPFFGDSTHDKFPGVTSTDLPQVSSVTFNYTAQESNTTPGCISWIKTDQNLTGGSTPYYYGTWDADVKIFHITSVATPDTGNSMTAESYMAKHEMRQLGAAVNGDYRAVGASLLTGGAYSPSNPQGIRIYAVDYPSYSSASVTDIPSDASITAAYLYWSGWFNRTLSSNPLSNSLGKRVDFYVNGHKVSTLTSTKSQWSTNCGAGYTYSCYYDVSSLVRNELKSESPSAGNWPGNATYAVGPASGCTLCDHGTVSNLSNPGAYTKAYAGWSLVVIYTSPSTQGHQLYLYDTFIYAPETGSSVSPSYGATSTHGSDIDPTGTTNGPGGVISGFLVPEPVPGETIAAQLTAFVGEGDWSYAGTWLSINSQLSNHWDYTSNDPSRLWDGITLDTSHLASGYPPYLPNTSSQPFNVWNSYSQNGLSDGVDIKTFNITWASGLINPEDTTARIDIPTHYDSWDLVYLILSFRSVTSTGHDIAFLIH